MPTTGPQGDETELGSRPGNKQKRNSRSGKLCGSPKLLTEAPPSSTFPVPDRWKQVRADEGWGGGDGGKGYSSGKSAQHP